MWRIEGSEPNRLARSSFDREKDLEELIKRDPSLLDQENLLIIGQQAQVQDVNDRIDLLAIDAQGTLVVIEIKRGKVSSPDEIQSIRYASYVSNWVHDSLEKQADLFYSIPAHQKLLKKYLRNEDANYEGFIQLLEQFCEEEYDLNWDQRIILVGTDIGEKVLPVLVWLNKKGVDIKFVQLQAFNDGEMTYVSPRTVFPLPKQEEMLVGTSAMSESKPWLVDGRNWHLRKRSSPESAKILTQIIEDLESLEDVEIISWNQKFYVAVRVDGRIWMSLKSFPNQVNVRVLVGRGALPPERFAELLKIPIERVDKEEKGQWDKVRMKLRITDTYDSESFKAMATEALESFKA